MSDLRAETLACGKSCEFLRSAVFGLRVCRVLLDLAVSRRGLIFFRHFGVDNN